MCPSVIDHSNFHLNYNLKLIYTMDECLFVRFVINRIFPSHRVSRSLSASNHQIIRSSGQNLIKIGSFFERFPIDPQGKMQINAFFATKHGYRKQTCLKTECLNQYEELNGMMKWKYKQSLLNAVYCALQSMKCYYITITCATENTCLVGRFAEREKIAHNTYLSYWLLSAARKWRDRWRTVTLWGKPCPSQSLWSSDTRFTFAWLLANSLPLSWWLTKPFLYFLIECWEEPSNKGSTSYLVCKSRSAGATSSPPNQIVVLI